MSLRRIIVLVTLLSGTVARAEEPARDPPPDPSRGESYDGRAHPTSPARKALWVPRVVLFPLRALWWAAEPGTRFGVESEQRHHLYSRLYSAITSDDGLVGVRPMFSWVTSFRPSAGAHFFHDRLLGLGTKSSLDISGGVDVFDVKLRLRPTRIGRPVQVFFDIAFNRRNDWLFTGIGSHVPLPPEASARYLQNRFDEALRVDLHVHRMLAFSLGGFFGARRFGNGESYSGDLPINYAYCLRLNGACLGVDPTLVPGFNTGTTFLRVSGGVHLDLRDNVIRPTLGALINFEGDYSHGVGSDDSSYFRLRGDIGIALNLWRHSHVLILRGATAVVLPVNDSIVPFSELATLGGPNDLRGFRVQEFRGYSSLFGTIEYRWPLLKWVETEIFADYGGVFGKNYQGIGATQMQPDIGFGFRLHSRDRFFIRMQFAYGFDGGWQVYLTGQNFP